jgi:hypothetical protein
MATAKLVMHGPPQRVTEILCGARGACQALAGHTGIVEVHVR